jgi:paraquat-inducible protein A
MHMGTPARKIDHLTATAAALVSCPSCRLLCSRPEKKGPHTRDQHICPRCGALLHSRKPASVARTWALIIAAAILYLPANLLPIMKTVSLGAAQSDTIISGVIYFITTGSWHLALIIFVASVVVPITKLLILIYLLLSVQLQWLWRPKDRTRLYRLIEAIGRWSMVDIFVVATMVALVRMDALGTVDAGPGALFFAAVVVITMLATECFDPRLIWDTLEEAQ